MTEKNSNPQPDWCSLNIKPIGLLLSGCSVCRLTTRRALRISRDFGVQRGTASCDSGKAALFRWESAAEPGRVPRNSVLRRRYVHAPRVPSGPHAILP